MNVLFLTRRFYPQIGGVEKHLLKISQLLVKDGHRVTIVAEALENDNKEKNWITNEFWQKKYKSAKSLGKEKNIDKSSKSMLDQSQIFNDEFQSHGIDETKKIIVYRLPKVKEGRLKKLLIWKWLWKNRRLIEEADLVHCHDVFYWFMPFKFFYLRKPVYTTFHGYEGKYPPAKKAIVIRKISEIFSWGNICVGDYIKKWYFTKPTFVTYGGVDVPKQFKASVKKKNNFLQLVFIGRLEEDTGVLLYLEALDELKKRKFKFKFVACGDGRLRSEAEKYGEVTGFIEDTQKYIESADIVLASSYLSILEAIAYRKLVISAYSSSLKKDYLEMSPFRNRIIILNNRDHLFNFIDRYLASSTFFDQVLIDNKKWIKEVSWSNVVNLYYKLWKVKK